MNLKPRLVFFVVIAYFLTIYTAIYSYHIYGDENAKSLSMSAQVSELDQRFEQLSFIPKLLSDDSYIVNCIADKSSTNIQLANQRLRKIQRESGLDFAFLLDKEGNTIASSNWNDEISFIDKNYAFRPYFVNAMRGVKATYFAVGATTGIPGYFIAEPVFQESEVAGVVVAKMALTAPVDTWKSLAHDSAVVDEYGVIILTTNENFLYKPTRTVSVQESTAIQSERRYIIPPRNFKDNESIFSRYIRHSKPLSTEPWQLMTFSPKLALHKSTMAKAVIAFISLLTLWLLYRTYKQQRRLVSYEQKHSRELEEKVRERTLELEQAQDVLISESNYVFLGRMSAAINHEINQPLTTLRMNLASLRQLIREPKKNIDEIEQTIIESDRTTKRITRVITSLRNYARSNTINLETVNLNNLISDSISTIELERPLMSQHLVVETYERSTSIFGNHVLLQQALLNLIYNAIDAVIQVPNPVITLNLTHPSSTTEVLSLMTDATITRLLSEKNQSTHYVNITVSDNGAGVPAHIADTLFEPFTSEKANHQGLGLGLTISNQIAEAHRGALTYVRKNNTSAFSLILPLQYDQTNS